MQSFLKGSAKEKNETMMSYFANPSLNGLALGKPFEVLIYVNIVFRILVWGSRPTEFSFSDAPNTYDWRHVINRKVKDDELAPTPSSPIFYGNIFSFVEITPSSSYSSTSSSTSSSSSSFSTPTSSQLLKDDLVPNSSANILLNDRNDVKKETMLKDLMYTTVSPLAPQLLLTSKIMPIMSLQKTHETNESYNQRIIEEYKGFDGWIENSKMDFAISGHHGCWLFVFGNSNPCCEAILVQSVYNAGSQDHPHHSSYIITLIQAKFSKLVDNPGTSVSTETVKSWASYVDFWEKIGKS